MCVNFRPSTRQTIKQVFGLEVIHAHNDLTTVSVDNFRRGRRK